MVRPRVPRWEYGFSTVSLPDAAGQGVSCSAGDQHSVDAYWVCVLDDVSHAWNDVLFSYCYIIRAQSRLTSSGGFAGCRSGPTGIYTNKTVNKD